eukprot:5555978-Pleurochrysis_carterae.AAC.1
MWKKRRKIPPVPLRSFVTRSRLGVARHSPPPCPYRHQSTNCSGPWIFAVTRLPEASPPHAYLSAAFYTVLPSPSHSPLPWQLQ